MEWIEKLQVPGLILAAAVIWWLFQLLAKRDALYERLSTEVQSQGKTLSRVAALLDLICRRSMAAGGRDGAGELVE